MTNIKPIRQEDQAAIRQDAQDMLDGQNTQDDGVCSNQTIAQPDRDRRFDALLGLGGSLMKIPHRTVSF